MKSGMIGIIASDMARYSMFQIALLGLRMPPLTKIQYQLTSDRILGRNALAKQAVEGDYEWLFFLDDDHTFGPGLLERLLSHNKQIVGSLYLQRAQPFLPIAYAEKDPDGSYWPLNLQNHTDNELVQILAIGTGGMLIYTDILKKLPQPWFEHGRASEDLIFCDKVYEHGLGPIYLDTGAPLGHLSPSAMHAHYDRETGKWNVVWALADGFSVEVPLIDPK